VTDPERPTEVGAPLKAAEDQAAAEAAREASQPGSSDQAAATSSEAPASPSRQVVGPGARDAVIRAEHVEFSQGGASRIEATTVSLSQGGAGRINAREVTISQGGAGIVQAGTVRLESEGNAFLVLSRNADVTAGSRVAVLIAGRTSGGTQALFDARSALALVGGFLLFRRLLGMFRRR